MQSQTVGIFDAPKELGTGKTIVLGFQHVFAMFGATVLVPIITGLSVSVTLFCAGIATLWFHFITKRKVPIFLGSSFAFLGAFEIVAPKLVNESGAQVVPNLEKLPYACGGVVFAGLTYVIIAGLIHIFGVKKVMKLFPPIVTGPMIVLIGLILAPSAVNNITALVPTHGAISVLPAIVAIAVAIICNIWGKGMVKLLPILISIIVAYIVSIPLNLVDFSIMEGRSVVSLPPFATYSPFVGMKFELNAIITFVLVALAAVCEHVGDIAAISATCNRNYIEDPGLIRTLLGDGIGTSIAGMFGGPANTTYSENTGVVALTGVCDPVVMEIAAVIAILLSLSPLVDGLINTIPTPVIGGMSFILYGMISAVGLRTLVEYKVDFAKSRNVLIAAIIMVSGFAFEASPLHIAGLEFKGLATAAIFGILLNFILPGKDE